MNRLLLIICTFLFCQFGISQSIQEGNREMSQGSKNAMTLMLGKTDAKSAEESWEKFIKEYKGKTKRNKKTGEIFSDDSRMPDLSSNTVDVYTKIREVGADAELTVWFDLGGAYLSSEKHAGGYAAAKVLLQKYSLTVSQQALEMEMETQQGILKKMQNDMQGLEKDQKSLEAEIAKCEKKIEEAKLSLEENAGSQKMKSEEIKVQEEKVKMVKSKISGL